MLVHLLGTGGADGVPGFYADTRVDRHARQNGGKDVRSRAAALVDGTIKLDLGPDTWAQTTRYGLDARDWCSVVFTHADADHFAIEELQYFLYPFNESEAASVTIYGNNVVIDAIHERYRDWPFDLVQTRSFVSEEFCGYTLTPVKANHGSPDEDTQNLILESKGKRFLYGTDTGVWGEPTWEHLTGKRLDGIVLECTEGFVLTPYNGHLDVDEFMQVIERLRSIGCVDSATKVVTTHHSHNGDATHDELVAHFEPHGVEVGYDGMTIVL